MRYKVVCSVLNSLLTSIREPALSLKQHLEKEEYIVSEWIDFKELKAQLSFIDVLEHYGVTAEATGEQVKCRCPLPGCDSSRGNPLSVNTKRNIFQCFGCRLQGNLLDFIALMNNLSPENRKDIHQAAVFAKKTFVKNVRSSKERQTEMPALVNPPLDFQLQSLDADDPWFKEHGFEKQTALHFEAGYCTRGYMTGRIAFPLHDIQSRIIGYGGLDMNNPTFHSACRLPRSRRRKGVESKFDPSLFLYNAHTIAEPVDDLILAWRIGDVWKTHQLGFPHAVACMDSKISKRHVAIIHDRLTSDGCVWIASCSDKKATQAFAKLGTHHFCRRLLKGRKDSFLSEEDISSVLSYV